MNEFDASNDALDDLLRAHAPAPLDDDGFVVRTLEAVEKAAQGTPARRRQPATPREIAGALAAERRRYAVFARLRHWGIAGVATGVALLVVAMVAAPGGVRIEIDADAATLPNWFPLWSVLAVGALWYAWQEFRAD
jgi:hypothetical protein